MKLHSSFILLLGVTVYISTACGPNQEEINRKKEQQEQRRQDSLAAVKAEILRQDSLLQLAQIAEFQAEQRRKKKEELEKNKPVAEQYNFGKEGAFCVQVESGKIPENLTRAMNRWKNEGFNNAYISIKHGTHTQDTWYRLRLGKFKSRSEAKLAAAAVTAKYKVSAWVDNTDDEVEK